MVDDVTKVELQKVDATTGKPVSGAKLQVIDSEGKVWYEWTSSEHSITITRYLRVSTPYMKSARRIAIFWQKTYPFEVKDEEDVQVVVMENQLEGRVTIDHNDDNGNVQTGDTNELYLTVVIGAVCLLALTTVIYLRFRGKHHDE